MLSGSRLAWLFVDIDTDYRSLALGLGDVRFEGCLLTISFLINFAYSLSRVAWVGMSNLVKGERKCKGSFSALTGCSGGGISTSPKIGGPSNLFDSLESKRSSS
jgi:hypothetical protein